MAEAMANPSAKEVAELEASPVEVDMDAMPQQSRSGAFFFFGSSAEASR